MLNKNIETFIACDCEYEEAKVVLFGAPYDSTTSYRPGARFAPRAIRGESLDGMESYSPYQNKDLEDAKVFDSGDLELGFGDPVPVLDIIEQRAQTILEDGKLPFMIGGEHLVTLGAVRAVAKKYPELHIIHFDAHADLREDYLDAQLSHACVLRRCWDILGHGRIHQFGIRSGSKEEFAWGKSGHVQTRLYDFTGLEQLAADLSGKPVYVTVDLDVLDPSVFPGTGTPEAGGVTFEQLRRAVKTACGLNVVGCDVNELCPPQDPSGISTVTAGKIIREMLLTLPAF